MDFTDVLSALWQGHYVEFSLLEHYLGLTFGEYMKNLQFARFVKWSKVGNGQDITCAFKNHNGKGDYCLTKDGLILTNKL